MTHPNLTLENRDGFIYYDGVFVPWREATTHVLTHTLHYGLGAFEGVRAYPTSQGTAIFRLHDHTKRLFQSAHILQIEIPATMEEVHNAQIAAIQRNQLTQAYIRPMVFLGAEALGIRTAALSTHLIIASWDWEALHAENQGGGVNAKVSSYTRHHINSAMSKAKVNGHYFNSILAFREISQDVDAAGKPLYQEAVMLDTNGYLAEGSGENIFIVRQGELHTPDLTVCLDGITRRTLIQLAEDCLGKRVIERRITRDEIYIADEAFFCGTAAEVVPIRSLDRRLIGNGKPGPITTELQQLYHDLVRGKLSDYHHWLTWC